MGTKLYPDAKQPDSMSDGLKFQEYVKQKLLPYGIQIDYYKTKEEQINIGESLQGYEVKFDFLTTKTYRGKVIWRKLSIEIAEKARASNSIWVPSGIYRRDNTRWYVQGNYDLFFVFDKQKLVEIHRQLGYPEEEKRGTIKTFYIPILTAFLEAKIVVVCRN